MAKGYWIVRLDVTDFESIFATMQGCDAAVYLVHSMADYKNYAKAERRSAFNFARAAALEPPDSLSDIEITFVGKRTWQALDVGIFGVTFKNLKQAHISDNGALAVGRFYRDPPVEMLNTAALGVDALSRRGVADPLSHLVVLRYLDFGLLIVREQPFDLASANAIRRFAADHHFTVTFDPLDRSGPFAEALAGTPVPELASGLVDCTAWEHGDRAIELIGKQREYWRGVFAKVARVSVK